MMMSPRRYRSAVPINVDDDGARFPVLGDELAYARAEPVGVCEEERPVHPCDKDAWGEFQVGAIL